MKRVLIATDFSKAAVNAARYGLAFSHTLEAEVYLYNAYVVPTPAPGLGMSISRYDAMVQIQDKLNKLAAELDPTRSMVHVMCDEGDPESSILAAAKEKNVDFIIVGMKGAGRNIRQIFGTVAASLAMKSPIPVIIVPEEVVYCKPKVIAFANDDSIDLDREVPVALTSVVKLFDSKLYVVKVVKDQDEKYAEMIETIAHPKKIMEVVDTSFQYELGDNIAHVLQNFIDKHHADMLVMIPHQHVWIETFFKRSNTKTMLFHSHIPIFILPESSTKE